MAAVRQTLKEIQSSDFTEYADSHVRPLRTNVSYEQRKFF
jgi:hypothetical protein